MKTLTAILKNVMGLLTNTGLVWFGYAGGALAVLIFTPKNWFWGVVFGILAGAFLFKNIADIKKWAEGQLKKLRGY